MRTIAIIVALLLISNVIIGAFAVAGPKVIIVGAGMSGISTAKTLSDAGIKDILILEATDRIGGRMRKASFTGLNVEVGANWVEGVNGLEINPIWEMANKLHLTKFISDLHNISSNTYKENGGLYLRSEVDKVIKEANKVKIFGEKLSKSIPPDSHGDISILASQRLEDLVPSTALEMVMDYFNYDYEFAEPPRVTSLQKTIPLPTFANFGKEAYFVADQRGFESLVYDLAGHFLRMTKNSSIVDPRLLLGKVVRDIRHSMSGVTVTTEDGSFYDTDYVIISVSIGVLQSKLIKFKPGLPQWKNLAICQFGMSVYTKIFLKFPHKFWPDGEGTEYFLYASERRGYYPVWQHFEKQFPGANVLLVTVTDEESRRIERQPDSQTKAEAMEVLRNMFGKHIPEATDILVPRWSSDRFFKGSFSNWPLGVNQYEFDQIRAPIGRVYFTGEHTSEHYNGYVHGAYLAGIDCANVLIKCIKYKTCEYKIKPKDSLQQNIFLYVLLTSMSLLFITVVTYSPKVKNRGNKRHRERI
ncbi:unnamed protein product [Musa textilis]